MLLLAAWNEYSCIEPFSCRTGNPGELVDHLAHAGVNNAVVHHGPVSVARNTRQWENHLEEDIVSGWSDDFTHDSSLNTGLFTRQWGDSSEFSFKGGLTLTSDGNAAGFLTTDGSATDSTGYGVYQANVSVPSNSQGPGILVVMWPASNQWPGPEVDLAEQLNGQAYMTVHWRGSDGSNQYQSHFLPNVNLAQPTTLAVDWEPGSLTYSVNGQQAVQYTSGGSVPVPKDAADGGQNEAFGAQVSSAAGSQLTLYSLSYSPSSASAPATTSAAVGSAPPSAITPATTNTSVASFASVGNSTSGSAQNLATTPGTDILKGGSGLDTFVADASNPDGWAEIDHFHSGDVLSILGFVSGQSTVTWTTATDKNGQTGATADISLAGNGKTDMAITFAGVSQSTAQNFGSGNWHSTNGTPALNVWAV